VPFAIEIIPFAVNTAHPEMRTAVRGLLLFGAPGALATLPALLNLRLDQVLLTTLVPASELGLYVAAVAWSGGLSPIIGATAPLILPLLSGGEAQPEHRRAVAAKVMRLSVLLSVLGGLVLLATTPLALRLLFGEPFLPAMRAALILAVASAVGGLNTLSGEVLRGMGEPRWSLVAELTSLPVNLLLLWLLLPTMGILGAALASLAAYLVASAVFLVALRGSTGRGVAALYLPRRADLDGLLLLARAPR